MTRARLGRFFPILFVLFWMLGVGFGFSALWKYASAPGEPGRPPKRWPAASAVPVSKGRATLVMIVHPHCPCTRASLSELAVLMARTRGRLAANVLFFKPKDFQDRWEKTDLWRTASAIPDARAMSDEGGVEAARFGSTTSGQVIVYGTKGRLLFSGGITGARGHAGDNPGRAAIESLVAGEPGPGSTPVFGCSIREANLKDLVEGSSLWERIRRSIKL